MNICIRNFQHTLAPFSITHRRRVRRSLLHAGLAIVAKL
jgi:hypothetical protein